MKLAKLLDKYPKLKFSCLSLNFFKDYARGIKEVCKRGGDQFKLNYDSIILSGSGMFNIFEKVLQKNFLKLTFT